MSLKCLQVLRSGVNVVGGKRNYSLAVNPLAKYDKHFLAVFPNVVRDLTDDKGCGDSQEIKEWFGKVLNYVCPDGSRRRGRVVVHGYHLMANNPSKEDIERSYYLGWCIELVQGYLCIIDDIIDAASWRRGRLAWHKVEGVGLARGLQDGFLVRSGVNELLKRHFREKPYYADLNDVINHSVFQVELGGALDLKASKATDYSDFTMKRYDTLVKYRTGYNSYGTVAPAMYMAGINDPKLHDQTLRLLIKIAKVLQAQDDCIDAFEDPDVSGKIGTDIPDRKCSWPAVAALERTSPKQRKVFEECYGQNDDKKIAKIREIYRDLKIDEVFKKFQDEAYHQIMDDLKNMDPNMPKEIFKDVLKVMYNRSF